MLRASKHDNESPYERNATMKFSHMTELNSVTNDVRVGLKLTSLTILTFILIAVPAFAHSGGEVERTSRGPQAQGCGLAGCHTQAGVGVPTPATVVRFDNHTDSITVVAGSLTEFTVVIAHPTAIKAGVNIAVKTTEFGTTNAGTLQATNNELQVFVRELTHKTGPKSMVGGETRYTFTWLAPPTPGVYFMRAIANAVNGNGDQGGDFWNWAPVLRVRVSIADGVESIEHDVDGSNGDALSDNSGLLALDIHPVPAHAEMTVMADVVPGETYSVNVLDITGSVVFTDAVTPSNNILQYVWNGNTSSGIQAPPGSYVVAVSGGGRVRRGRAILVR